MGGLCAEHFRLGPLVGVLADTLNWETNTASSAAGAATMAPNGIALYRRRRRTGIGEEFTAMTHGDLARPPLLVVGVLASAALIVDSILGGVIGAIVNTTIGMTNGDADEFMTAYSVVSRFVALPLTLLATYLLAKACRTFPLESDRAMACSGHRAVCGYASCCDHDQFQRLERCGVRDFVCCSGGGIRGCGSGDVPCLLARQAQSCRNTSAVRCNAIVSKTRSRRPAGGARTTRRVGR